MLLLKDQESLGGHQQGAGECVGLPLSVLIGFVCDLRPTPMKCSLLRRGHLSQAHKLVSMQQAVSQLVGNDKTAAWVTLLQPLVSLGRRQNLNDAAVSVVLRIPFRIVEFNHAATYGDIPAGPVPHLDVEAVEQQQSIDRLSWRVGEPVANISESGDAAGWSELGVSLHNNSVPAGQRPEESG